MATLSDLRTRARYKADMELRSGQDESTHFITNAVATQFINDAIKEVYRLLANANPDEYTEPSSDITTTTGTLEYSLPADVWKIRGVEYQRDANNDRWTPIHKANWGERNKSGLKYRRRGTKIRFLDDPGSKTVRVWYVPKPTALSADADVYDGSEESEDLVVVKAAKMMKMKEESPIDELLLEEQRLTTDLLESNQTEDLEEPDTITDVHREFVDEWPGRKSWGWEY